MTVITIPKSHIITVLQTSARDLDTGDIFLDSVTAIGTEIPIEMIRPMLSTSKNVFFDRESQN